MRVTVLGCFAAFALFFLSACSDTSPAQSSVSSGAADGSQSTDAAGDGQQGGPFDDTEGQGNGGIDIVEAPPEEELILEFDPNPLDFGVVKLGEEPVLGGVIIRNPTYDPMTIPVIQKVQNDPHFLFSVTSLLVYGKGEESFSVYAVPDEVGIYEEELRFLDEEYNVVGVLPIKLSVVPPDCLDEDGDLHGEGCEAGDDCDETDPSIYVGAEERCDLVDNDCDGYVDEEFLGVGEACVGGLGECTTPGKLECNEEGTAVICSADITAGGVELCNGIDDDCDGAIDELFPDLSLPCFVGVGACMRLGKLVCSADGITLVCDVQPGEPTLEECFDEIDNDCDGVLDEGDLEICDDGEDNDCDGLIDESGSEWGEVFFARSWKNETVAIYKSNEDGTFQEPILLELPDEHQYRVQAVGDFDGDLYLDLVVVQTKVDNGSLCSADGDCPPNWLCKGGLCHQDCKFTGTCDNPDAECIDMSYNATVGDTYCVTEHDVYLVQKGCEEDLKFTQMLTLPPGESLGNAIDADGNGHLDFVALGHHSVATGVTWLNDGELGFTRVESTFDYSSLLTWKYFLGETSRDFTGDGYVDLMAGRFTSGGNPPTGLFLIEGVGDGTFEDPVQISQSLPYPANLITANDFDGDGDHDLVGGLDDDGQPGGAWMLIQDGEGWQAPYPVFDVAPNMNSGGEKPGFGKGASFDFTADAYPDVIVAFAPEECGSYVWGCTQISDPNDVCYGGNCRKLAMIPNLTGSPCGEGEGCFEGECVPGCVPACEGKLCGGDGCYGSCGECPGGQVCSEGQCTANCIPNCGDKTCGENGCGGSCGSCGVNGACVEGACVSGCVPNCTGKACGGDGCGGTCAIFGEPLVIEFSDNNSLVLAVPTNVPPTIPSVELVPPSPQSGEQVECVVTEISLDLDPVTYRWTWYRDDVYAKDVGNLPVLPQGLVQEGESWRCEVRATDGLEWSPVASVEALIGEEAGE